MTARGERLERIDPVIWEMARKLPAAGSWWSDSERDAWLAAMRAIFNVVYRKASPS